MRPVAPRRAPGFTLVELVITVAIAGLLLGIGIPSLSRWMENMRTASASDFYADGLRLAHQQAISHNSEARFVLTENAQNGQLDWQVDVCYPSATAPCNASSGNWSSVSAAAADDPNGSAGFKSVFRSAEALPSSTVMQYQLSPDGATSVYFTPSGWVDTTVSPALSRIQLAPPAARPGSFPTQAVALTLAGMASRCDPTVTVPDSRACPP